MGVGRAARRATYSQSVHVSLTREREYAEMDVAGRVCRRRIGVSRSIGAVRSHHIGISRNIPCPQVGARRSASDGRCPLRYRFGGSRNVSRNALDRAVIITQRRSERDDRIGNFRNIRGETSAVARLIADPSRDSVGPIGISRSIGRSSENGGSINGGGTCDTVYRIGIFRNVGVFLPSDGCLLRRRGLS